MVRRNPAVSNSPTPAPFQLTLPTPMKSSFGRVFRVTTFGESHCASIGVIIDGVPPRIPLTEADIQPQLDRRRPGQSALTTPRSETDTVRILSGTENGVTLGTPICLMIPNKDTRPVDYLTSQSSAPAPTSSPSELSPALSTFIPRPSHADYTYLSKYGVSASSGGGRASARETAARVAAGAVAEVVLRRMCGVRIVAYVSQVGTASLRSDVVAARKAGDDTNEGWVGVDGWLDSDLTPSARAARAACPSADAAGAWGRELTRAVVDASPTRCPHPDTARAMEEEIRAAADAQDSVGGIVSCVVYGLPPGLGEPCFDKLEATLAHAMMSIPASKGFEIGSGFACAGMRGSDHNDPFAPLPELPSTAIETVGTVGSGGGAAGFPPRLHTVTNLSGGIQGGISNGMYLNMSVAFKPAATIGLPQQTATLAGQSASLEARGRHDPCVAPRAVAVVEAMAALALVDALLLQGSRETAASRDRFVGRACDFYGGRAAT